MKPCDAASLAKLKLDKARIVSVSAVPAGSFTPLGSPIALASLPDFCRVQAVATPTPDSLINFEVWLPKAASWNEKLVTTGNGGYSPALNYRDMAYALRQGYAALGGDTGHQTKDPNDLTFVVGHPEKMVDFGTRSIHAITVAGKRIIAAFEGRAARRAYYYGCSTGGHQGFAEIQRYPADFDGVIAGAPANNRVRLNAGFLWQFLANHNPGDNSTPIIPPSKLPLITNAVVAACDANDGVTDGVIDDPRSCRFDPAVLKCKQGDADDCLTPPQLAALEKMYAGARNPRSGAQVYPGWPKSSEALTVAPNGTVTSGWSQYWGTNEPARSGFWRYWVFDNPRWDWWTFDFDRDLARADAEVGKAVDQVNTDLSAFKARGGRVIVYHGWQDPVVNALDTITYYEKVKARQGSQTETDRFFRLFLVPGMGHCAGGTGTTSFGNQGTAPPLIDAQHDCLSALDRWVDQGVAPDSIVASKIVNGITVRTRPLCPYPKKAVYKGIGNTDDATNFTCR
ncbi:MAG TPA: tannase/feruloyl esterase family alpha/beta hydrolase [Blastocatellia bacterium]|nr:tannase/feruloyl esterase family alpha/beta hydrolase [Blastocatellia bacterium]